MTHCDAKVCRVHWYHVSGVPAGFTFASASAPRAGDPEAPLGTPLPQRPDRPREPKPTGAKPRPSAPRKTIAENAA